MMPLETGSRHSATWTEGQVSLDRPTSLNNANADADAGSPSTDCADTRDAHTASTADTANTYGTASSDFSDLSDLSKRQRDNTKEHTKAPPLPVWWLQSDAASLAHTPPTVDPTIRSKPKARPKPKMAVLDYEYANAAAGMRPGFGSLRRTSNGRDNEKGPGRPRENSGDASMTYAAVNSKHATVSSSGGCPSCREQLQAAVEEIAREFFLSLFVFRLVFFSLPVSSLPYCLPFCSFLPYWFSFALCFLPPPSPNPSVTLKSNLSNIPIHIFES